MNSRPFPALLLSVLLLTIVLPAALPHSALAQQKILHGVNAPGGESANGVYKVYDIVGQGVTGTMSAPAAVHHAGYIPVVREFLLSSMTAVTITSFIADVGRDRVLLRWVMGGSGTPLGYYVYRSESPEKKFMKISGGLIPAEYGASYEDTDIRPGNEYFYRIGAVDGDGEFLSQTISVTTPAWKTDLRQNRPNPFNPTTTISFYLAEPANVELIIYDARGALVRKLIDGPTGSGENHVQWNGINGRGEVVGSGIYFYRLRAGKEVYTRKMTLLK